MERKSEEKQTAARDARGASRTRSRETRGGRPLRNSIQSSAEVHQASQYSARLKASSYRRVNMPPGIHCIAISKIEYSRFRVSWGSCSNDSFRVSRSLTRSPSLSNGIDFFFSRFEHRFPFLKRNKKLCSSLFYLEYISIIVIWSNL